MNLLLLTDADRVQPGADRFAVDDRRHLHLVTILRVVSGQRVRVGLLDGPIGVGSVVKTSSRETELEVEWTAPPPDRPPIHLILAIPRPKSLKKLLPEIVALGIGRLTLLRSWRVAQPYLSSPLLQPEVHRSLILDGLMQAGSTRLPEVDHAMRFQPFIEDVAPRLNADLKLLAHPRAPRPLANVRPKNASVALAIGPEGGWIEHEIDAFDRAGFAAVSLGDRVLRVETACVALLANLNLLRTIE